MNDTFRKQAIDHYIDKAHRNSYATLMDVGRKGLNVATDTLVKTAVTVSTSLFLFVLLCFNILKNVQQVKYWYLEINKFVQNSLFIIYIQINK